MVGKEEYRQINHLLNERLDQKDVLIAVHRGSWGGNIIENTNCAYELALRMGADLFECDLTKSTDGELYCFHDGGEDRVFHISKNMKTMSSKEIDELTALNSLGLPSCHHIQKFEAVLQYFNHGELFNVDRSWWYLDRVDAVMRKYPQALHQAIIKTPVADEYLKFFASCDIKYMYMPIAKNMEEVRKVLSYPEINTVGVEAIAKTEDSEMIQPDNIRWMKEQGLFVWTNAITLSGLSQEKLCGDHGDDRAVLGDEEGGWGDLVRFGYNVIQTDWPAVLKEFLHK